MNILNKSIILNIYFSSDAKAILTTLHTKYIDNNVLASFEKRFTLQSQLNDLSLT